MKFSESLECVPEKIPFGDLYGVFYNSLKTNKEHKDKLEILLGEDVGLLALYLLRLLMLTGGEMGIMICVLLRGKGNYIEQYIKFAEKGESLTKYWNLSAKALQMDEVCDYLLGVEQLVIARPLRYLYKFCYDNSEMREHIVAITQQFFCAMNEKFGSRFLPEFSGSPETGGFDADFMDILENDFEDYRHSEMQKVLDFAEQQKRLYQMLKNDRKHSKDKKHKKR